MLSNWPLLIVVNCTGREINFSDPCRRSIARLLQSTTMIQTVDEGLTKANFLTSCFSRNSDSPDEMPISATLKCFSISSLSSQRKLSSFSEVTLFFKYKLIQTGLSNSLVTRAKMGDPAQRGIAVNALDKMSGDLLLLLQFDEPEKEGQTLDLHIYWLCCLNFIAQVLCGGIIPPPIDLLT
jgi:hypothetical protein